MHAFGLIYVYQSSDFYSEIRGNVYYLCACNAFICGRKKVKVVICAVHNITLVWVSISEAWSMLLTLVYTWSSGHIGV